MEDSSISSQVEERSTRKRQYEDSVSYTEVKRRAFSVPSPKKAVMHDEPVPPKSISVTQMLKLGKVVESPEVVNLYQFDFYIYMNFKSYNGGTHHCKTLK